jgi:Uma2 family endonuclease
VPDLNVFRRDTPYHDNGYDPGGVLLVVECVSPSSVTMDRLAKPAVYAEQGIPFFWRVDEGPCLQSFRLDPRTGRYDTAVEIAPGDTGEPLAPWPVRFDTAELVMPHKRR